MSRSGLMVTASAGALALVVGAASAADLGTPSYPGPVVGPAAFDWSGPYIGGHFGWAVGSASGLFDPSEQPGNSIVSPNGPVGGIHAGFNWQHNTMVFGVEGDLDATGLHSVTTHDAGSEGLLLTNDILASVRGRVGVSFNQLLLFATAGVAFNNAEAHKNPGGGGSSEGIFGLGHVGGVVGIGVDWMTPHPNLSVRADVSKYFFSGTSLPADCCGGTGGNVDMDPWVFRVGASYHFRPSPY
jgi:outer membrane immunogenic protein